MSVALMRRRVRVGDVTPEPPADWQLPEGHFMPAKMSMTAVYPRPDGETQTFARHRHAYPSIEYRVPVVIQGGAYPFLFELVDGPSGMTVDTDRDSADYGTVSWTPSGASGPHTVTVRVTDQDLNTVDVTWTVTAATTNFLFLDPSVGSSGDGTIGSPFKTFPDVFGTAPDHTTNSGKILVLRSGTHTAVGFSSTSNNLRLRNAQPMAWIAYPGESPVVDCSGAIIAMFDGTNPGDDFYTAGVRYENSRADTADSRFFFFGSLSGDRTTWYRCAFDGLVRGTSGTDNPGAIVMFDNNSGTGRRTYVAIIGCTLTDFKAPLHDIYDTFYGVSERNTLGASTDGVVNQGIYNKQNNGYWSIRRNTSTLTNFENGGIGHGFAGTNAGAAQLMEWCYNLIRVPSPGDSNYAAAYLDWSEDAFTGSTAWYYRNTFVGRCTALNSANRTVVMEQNVVVNNDANPANSSNATGFTETDNLEASVANIGTLIDGDYLLTGSTRTTYLGQRGHEISAGA